MSNLGYLYGILLPEWKCHDDKSRLDPRPDQPHAHAEDEPQITRPDSEGGSQWKT